MGDYIVRQLTSEISCSDYLGVLADEVTDFSNKEQTAVAVCYIKHHGVMEKLLLFAEAEDMTGATLCDTIFKSLSHLGVDLKRCRAQRYDGAGNMTRKTRECQALFKAKYPLANYFHCASHQLNLTVSRLCLVTEMHSMMATVKTSRSVFPVLT